MKRWKSKFKSRTWMSKPCKARLNRYWQFNAKAEARLKVLDQQMAKRLRQGFGDVEVRVN